MAIVAYRGALGGGLEGVVPAARDVVDPGILSGWVK
jgi:hypothetical protein